MIVNIYNFTWPSGALHINVNCHDISDNKIVTNCNGKIILDPQLNTHSFIATLMSKKCLGD